MKALEELILKVLINLLATSPKSILELGFADSMY